MIIQPRGNIDQEGKNKNKVTLSKYTDVLRKKQKYLRLPKNLSLPRIPFRL
jgi:hypothetical protein